MEGLERAEAGFDRCDEFGERRLHLGLHARLVRLSEGTAVVGGRRGEAAKPNVSGVICAVMPEARSEARTTTAFTVSSTVIGRPSGGTLICGARSLTAATPAPVSWMVRVSGIAGPCTQLTRMPADPNSAASAWVITSTAPRAAEIPATYSDVPPYRVGTAPGPRRFMIRAASRAVRNCEPTILFSGMKKSSTGVSSDRAHHQSRVSGGQWRRMAKGKIGYAVVFLDLLIDSKSSRINAWRATRVDNANYSFSIALR